jgi:tetratricopeptide (TPR) repeat protein
MLLRLANPAARLLLVLFAFLLVLALSFFSIRNALAAYYAGLGTSAGYERAVQLEPGNYENWYLLGHYWQYSLNEPDPARAIDDYRVALQLNPRFSDAWLDLATLYEFEDRLPEARDAFLAAKRAYPLSAEVSWRYGNFLLRQGDVPQAFAEMRRAVYVDPSRSAEAFSRCWRVNPDIHSILDKVIPPNRDAYLDIIRELSHAYQLEPALVVWDRLVSIHPALRVVDVIPFADALLQNHQFDDTLRVWNEAVRLSSEPPTGDPPGSAIWDGGFETDVHGGALAWFFSPPPRGAKINLDTQEKRSGRASLRLDFDGKHNVSFEAVCENAIVRPATNYLFSAWVHTQRLTTDQGIRFRLMWTESSRHNAVETPDVHGSESWTEVQIPWTSPPDVHQLRVCVARDTSGKVDSQIQGTAWVDDVSLVPQGPVPSKP